MSDVASLELCKELYELSGWAHTDSEKMWRHHLPINMSEVKYRGEVENDNFRFRRSPEALRFREENKFYPAYSLGYLLRKLPAPCQVGSLYTTGYEAYYCLKKPFVRTTGDTPEDATAKLCIELFKQGILR